MKKAVRPHLKRPVGSRQDAGWCRAPGAHALRAPRDRSATRAWPPLLDRRWRQVDAAARGPFSAADPSGEGCQLAAVVWRDPLRGTGSPEGRVGGGASPVGSTPERGDGGARWWGLETWALRKDDGGAGTPPRATVLFGSGDAGGPGRRMEE
ncbi:hypothetical protein NDU88_007227 [Pleurodeles waltl]|uniref:Uncharacterized protein n=1 Tax=Pleurodeles waltl TaxID=8319 RepID=A0AAV7VSY7_PLEWA|nr:hypothetical protein NDU88_007227 [Pleurodeles waltl]